MTLPSGLSTAAIASVMLQASLDCIIAIDQHNVVVEWNPAAERTFSFTRAEAVGRNLSSLIIPPKYREAHERGMQRYLDTRIPHLVNHRVQVEAQRRNGEIFPCEIAFHPLEVDGHSFFAAYLRDLTEERRINHERSQLAMVAEASTDFIAFSDLNNRLMYINAAGRKLVGYEGAIPAHAQLSDVVHPDDRDVLTQQIWPQVREEGSWAGEMRLIHQGTGAVIDVHRTIFTVYDPVTKVATGYATVTRDIRERKRIEQERLAWQVNLETQVAERTRELNELNAELDAFNYSISHDLRAPIRHMTGFASLLRRSLLAENREKSDQYLSMIEQAASRMALLVEALLRLAQQARQPLRRGTVNLSKLAREVREELAPELVQRQVDWTGGALPVVLGDETLLRQVLLNLMSNAVKYTRMRERALIDVRARREAAEWVIEVRDNGVGFDPQYSGKLFGVFQRLHGEQEFEGIGVGLANVQRIVKRHGGRVWATAVLGEGATFSFTLPV
ncbi:sensor histidine kinase [Deinococcus ruber]|uniref:histidine kinase n=1 Tax=Deinococcus ruber TaxID=1848197 RepID=A0A918C329_9DEIO|nr:PAS domain S-box protein [Deinococcus ruber]GGR03118.1 hypothetical protein GCM10008957_14960 [Deinococcus ruber]